MSIMTAYNHLKLLEEELIKKGIKYYRRKIAQRTDKRTSTNWKEVGTFISITILLYFDTYFYFYSERIHGARLVT